jgi:hypothetical protein
MRASCLPEIYLSIYLAAELSAQLHGFGFSAAHARPGHPPRRGMPLIRVNLPANSSRNGPKARECATLPGGFKGRGVYRAAHQHLLKRHREGHLPHRKRSDGPASKLSLLVEVGSFPGQSSCVMAQLLLATPKAERARLRFHVVDRFGGLQSFQSAQSAARQAIHRHGSSYAAWSANMIETGSITGIDQVSRASSVDGSLLLQYANESVAFMYLDTSHLDRLTRCARCPSAKEITCMRRELRDCMHVPATVNSYPPREILCKPDVSLLICISRLELAAWWPKIQRGGWLCGADYCRPSERPAVDEFFQRARVRVHYWGHSQFCAGKGVDASPRGTKVLAALKQERGGGARRRAGGGGACEGYAVRGGSHRRGNGSVTRSSTT